MKPNTESRTPTHSPPPQPTNDPTPKEHSCRQPTIADGIRMWKIARDSRALDLNSGYSYLLWCRDFHDTSTVAEIDGRVVGFVTGFVRPRDVETVFVWQVAVDASARGQGVAADMLDNLLDHLALQGITRLETTIAPENTASIALFTALARNRYSAITTRELFTPNHFPDGHGAEELYVIGNERTEGSRR